MIVLIYGSNGWIGGQFIDILENQKITYIKGKCRVDDRENLIAEIDQINPTHVISFIGRTTGSVGDKRFLTIDYLEQEGKLMENIRDNLFSPIQLALVCKSRNIHYTYFGTGCIFQYAETYEFTEQSKPNFFGSSYSIVKGFTDQLTGLLDNTLNLRIRMPITGNVHPRNFITKITNYEKICSIPNSMTVLDELLPLIPELMKQGEVGTLNFTNTGVISHNEILTMFKEIADPEFVWENFTLEEQRQVLSCDRSNNQLDTTKLCRLFPQVKHVREAVREALIKYKLTYKKRINLLVTGGCGFIGSHFINSVYRHERYNIINIDAMYYSAKIENVNQDVRNSQNYHFIDGNLIKLDLLNILKKYRVTQVIHFAAQSHVQNSFDDSLQYTQDNILGTHCLLEACRRYGKIAKFIHVSTDEVYGESSLESAQPKTEQSVLCPTNPYAGTKAGAELLVNSYYYSYGLPVIVTRGNNVYGPNQYPEKLIPKFIQHLKRDEKVPIQGDGHQLRVFMHVDDVVRAFETILEKGVIGEIYNIGSDAEYSVFDVAEMLIREIKGTTEYDKWIEYVPDRPFNDKRYYIDNQKLRALGWNISETLSERLKELI